MKKNDSKSISYVGVLQSRYEKCKMSANLVGNEGESYSQNAPFTKCHAQKTFISFCKKQINC